MRFDWLRFLNAYHVEYVDKGPNVAAGNVNIRCPWCGDADSSHHLGISVRGAGWGCWRNHTHRGRRPHRLIQALLNCSYLEAARIVGDEDTVPLGSDKAFGDQVAGLLSNAAADAPAETVLEYPPEIKPLHDAGRGRIFIDYLTERLYSREDAAWLARRYGLRYAVRGPFGYRIVVPVIMPEGLVTWTGRTIADATIRYRSLSADPEKAAKEGLPLARLSIDKTLFNYVELTEGGDALVVSEGPFDALRLDFLGAPDGIRGTCVFGKNISEDQILLFETLADRFAHRVLLLDRDASLDTIALYDRLRYLRFKAVRVPQGVKDPALFKTSHMRWLREQIVA